MFGISDLFQWERFVTPTVIKVFYWLAVIVCVLMGIAGAVSSLRDMAFNPFVGLVFLVTSLLCAFMGVIVTRIIAETCSSCSASTSISARSAIRACQTETRKRIIAGSEADLTFATPPAASS